jgi:ferric-chelate reductase [NAD(P)H]
MKNKNNVIEEALGNLTYGLYVVTTSGAGKINGMIANWISQVSFDPPLIIACISKERLTHKLIHESNSFGINIMDENDINIIGKFGYKSGEEENKFKDIKYSKSKRGNPILNNSIAYLECEVISYIEPGDHTIFIAKVIDGKKTNIKKGKRIVEQEI